MRYSILGFNQEKVLSLFAIIGKKENGDYIYAKLDSEDLLILNLLADFPNRTSVIKRMIDDKVFFWASYDAIINELPILNIKKQALANRFDKLVLLGIVERKYIAVDAKHQNATFFTLTNVYESLLYQKEGYRSQIREGIVVEYDTPSNSQILDVYNNIDNNNIVDNREKEIDKSISKKKLDLSFIDSRLLSKVEEWLTYRTKEKRQKQYTQEGLVRWYNLLWELSNGDVNIAIKIINNSMEQSYLGIFKPKGDNNLQIGQKLVGKRREIVEESKQDIWP